MFFEDLAQKVKTELRDRSKFQGSDKFLSSVLKRHEKKGFQHKNSALSVKVQNESNVLFNQKYHDEKLHKLILLLCTKSIALADEDSEEQALAYNNRSALLMHLHKYKECLVDIDRACKITKSSTLKKKLLFCKEKCLSVTNTKDEVENLNFFQEFIKLCKTNTAFFNSIQKKKMVSENSNQDQSYLLDTGPFSDLQEKFNKIKVPKLKSPNEKIPNFSNCLSLEYNEKYGRHVVATRDIKPGEVLVIEKGYVVPAIDKIYLVCSYCLNYNWNGISCPSCTYAVYCSEECKMKAWEEYHDIECLILPALLSEAFQNIDKSQLMFSLRLFLKFFKSEGPENLFDAVHFIESNNDAFINGFLTNGKFDSSKFQFYLNLAKHPEPKPQSDDDSMFNISILLLNKYTKIFEWVKVPKEEISPDRIRTAALMHKMKKIVNRCAYSFQDVGNECACAKPCSIDCPKNLGLVISPCSSLFNHSCVDNVSRIFCKNGIIMIVANQPIKKNEQLFLNYGVDHCIKKKMRQTVLKRFYGFTCTCEACENNWTGDPQKLQPEFDTLSKIIEDFEKFEEKLILEKKKIDCVTLEYTIKMIELSYKHISNNFNAYMFCKDLMNYMCSLYRKLYGVDISTHKCANSDYDFN